MRDPSLALRVTAITRERRVWKVLFDTQGLFPCFFAKKAQRFDRRTIVDGKQHRRLARIVFMGVPVPQRHDEGVALFPFEFLTVNPSRARAAKGVVDDGVCMAVRAAFFARAKHLHVAVHGRQRRAAADRIRVTQQHPVVRIARPFGDRLKSLFGFLPGVAIRGAIIVRCRNRGGLRAQNLKSLL